MGSRFAGGFQAAIRRLIARPPVTALLARLQHRLDLFVLQRTGGRASPAALMAGLPVGTLTTTGARSALPRTVPLVMLRDTQRPERLVLVASNWGQARYPAWYHNLTAHPTATVTFGGRTARYTAREISGPLYDQYWAQAVATYPGYAAYRESAAGRSIPIVLLEPDAP